MSVVVSSSHLDRLREFVCAHMGWHFPAERQKELERGIAAAAEEFGFADPEQCIDWLTAAPTVSPQQIEILASHLVIGETYFFRERGSFLALEQHVLPELIAERHGGDRHLRIWSAGCCTGEEAYSLAIAVARALPARTQWNVTILATDINRRFLHKAREGVFSRWSFRDLPPEFQERYFVRTPQGHYQLLPQIQRMVHFDYLNLIKDTYPSLANNTHAMDLILCRNVLIYLDPAQIPELLGKLGRSLAECGWLMLGAVETGCAAAAGLTPRNFPGAILYQKRGGFHCPAPDAKNMPAVESSEGSRPQLVADAPDDLPAAVRLYEAGLYAEAAAKLRQWTAAETVAPAVLALAVRVSANLGDLAGALHWCERALATDPLNAGFHYLRATTLQEQGDDAGATAALRRAIFLDPDFAIAHFTFGLVAGRRGQATEGLRHLHNALRIVRHLNPAEVLPWSEGITAEHLAETITALLEQEQTP